jgi:NAD(P)-dependent dehydrogenase (short-subunit alcohol dehydrogenase family)
MTPTSSPAGVFDPLASFSLRGKVVVLTGASSGLGGRFARVIDALGATSVLAARPKDRLDAVVAELRHAEGVACDVGEDGANEALIQGVLDRHGRVDVVIANAGIANAVPAVKEQVSDYRAVVEIDLIAPFALARAAQPAMRSQESGSIVMVASVAGFRSMSLLPQAGYVAAKTGLIGLTRELALQWARYGIRVNALCPGMFPSEMTTDITEHDNIKLMFESAMPLGRLGQNDELDGALAFLASDASSYMTGQTLVIDGGVSC